MPERAMCYKQIIRPLLFQFDPESVHAAVMKCGSYAARFAPMRALLERCFSIEDSRLAVRVLGLEFRNPIGLAAGFDKDCTAVDLFAALGFGHIEIGTVTSQSQLGNPRPRIFRFPQDSALINRMGFPSDGVQAVKQRLLVARERNPGVVLGVNIGKLKSVPVEEALEDYKRAFEPLQDCGDYFVVNVSSPNTPDLRRLQEPARLRELLTGLQALNKASKPLLVKVAPDLSEQNLEEVLSVCFDSGIAGIIVSNTTLSRNGLSVETSESGGLSGPPLRARALELVRFVAGALRGKMAVIGVGGISCSDDVLAMLEAGASLVQVYTSFVYEGPALVSRLCTELLANLDRRGLNNVADLKKA